VKSVCEIFCCRIDIWEGVVLCCLLSNFSPVATHWWRLLVVDITVVTFALRYILVLLVLLTSFVCLFSVLVVNYFYI